MADKFEQTCWRYINVDDCWATSGITQEETEREMWKAFVQCEKNVSNMRNTNQLGNFQPFLPKQYKLGKLLESWKILILKRISIILAVYLLTVEKLQKVHVYTACVGSSTYQHLKNSRRQWAFIKRKLCQVFDFLLQQRSRTEVQQQM